MAIAVFDVDRTLLEGDSLLLAAKKSNNLIELIWFCIKFIPYLFLWKIRLINRHKIKEIFIDKFQICKKYNLEMKNNNPDWLTTDLRKMIRRKALMRINMHKKKGDIVVLCSASPDMIIEPLAKYLNVDLICTNLLKIENKWVPIIKGKNCQGIEKLKRLEEKYDSLKNQKLEVYGDSKGDKEILNTACIPHYRDFSDKPNDYPIFSITSTIPIIGIVFLIYFMLNNFENLSYTDKSWSDIWKNILIGEILIIISYIIRFIRWKIILTSIHLNPPILKNIYIWMGSFAFTATPGKAGEAVRVILLNKECNLPNIPVLLALIIERLTDAFAVLIIFIINLYFIENIDFIKNLNFILISLIIVSFSILIFHKRQKIENLLIFLTKKLLPQKKLNLNNKNLEIIRILFQPKNIAISIVLGLIAWIIEGTSFFIILKGYELSISWLGATFAHTTSSLIGALTFMPGGLGATEASTIGLLTLQGIPLSIGTSSTLLIRIMTLWFATILGLMCLVLNNSIVKRNSLTSKNYSRN